MTCYHSPRPNNAGAQRALCINKQSYNYKKKFCSICKYALFIKPINTKLHSLTLNCLN